MLSTIGPFSAGFHIAGAVDFQGKIQALKNMKIFSRKSTKSVVCNRPIFGNSTLHFSAHLWRLGTAMISRHSVVKNCWNRPIFGGEKITKIVHFRLRESAGLVMRNKSLFSHVEEFLLGSLFNRSRFYFALFHSTFISLISGVMSIFCTKSSQKCWLVGRYNLNLKKFWPLEENVWDNPIPRSLYQLMGAVHSFLMLSWTKLFLRWRRKKLNSFHNDGIKRFMKFSSSFGSWIEHIFHFEVKSPFLWRRNNCWSSDT